MSTDLSRRGFFTAFTRILQRPVEPPNPPPSSPPPKPVDQVAIIQGRFCIALTSFCSVCHERCPVPGAMRVERGLPTVVADVCTGCGICHDVCPAPRNAVLLMPRRKPPTPIS